VCGGYYYYYLTFLTIGMLNAVLAGLTTFEIGRGDRAGASDTLSGVEVGITGALLPEVGGGGGMKALGAAFNTELVSGLIGVGGSGLSGEACCGTEGSGLDP